MKFAILGPVEARVAGVPVPLGGPRERKALAALLLDANRAVPAARLIEVLWGDDPPPTCGAQLRNTMTALRRHLNAPTECAKAPIVRSGDGFLIQVGRDGLDATRFDDLVSDAAKLAEDGRLLEAAETLRSALALWRGPALSGLDGAALEIETYRWEERRLACLERRIEFDLALGRHREVAGELAVLVAEHPERERLLELHLLALYRSGRRQDALTAFAAARDGLAEQTGLDPSLELTQLHQAILRGDPALLERHDGVPAQPAPAVAPAPLAREVPAQLPPAVRGFTGRWEEIGELDSVLRTADESPTAVAIAVLWGTAGVGKTSLAVHWAHTVATRFPDGQLYVNLRGFDPGGVVMSPSEAVRGFLDAFGVPAERIPADLAAQAALYRTLVDGKRILVVVDNARDAEQVRPLLPGSATCVVVITSRNQLPGLVVADGAHPVSLGLLSADEARLLLARRLGQHRLDAEPAAVEHIITSCARLPLALGIVAARAATHPKFPLDDLADELREARGGLDAFASDDEATDARAVLSWSSRALSADAARLFRLLGLHTGPDVSTAAAASLAGVPTVRARRLLSELTRAHLVAEHTSRRYAFHDLLRAYAAEQASAVDSADDRRAALHRVLDHYLHTAHAADRLLTPYRDQVVPAPPRDDVALVDLSDHDRALAWFVVEHTNLVVAVEQAASAGFSGQAWQLASMLSTYLDRRGHWPDAMLTQNLALEAARHNGDRVGQARALRGLARAAGRIGRADEAYSHLHGALEIYRDLDDRNGQARTLYQFAWVLYRQGRYDEALDRAHQALDRYEGGNDHSGHAEALNAIGWFHALLGDPERAIEYCQRALAAHREIGDRDGLAQTWDSLGYADHHRGRHADAATSYQHAIDLWRDLGDRWNEADTLVRLGDTFAAAGQPGDAGRT